MSGASKDPRAEGSRPRVLFLCTANSCRSQMAEGLLRAMAGDRFEVRSAGALPTSVHPRAVDVMAEDRIDMSESRSKSVEEFAEESFDYVITVCAGAAKDVCPVFRGKASRRLEWGFPDPAGAEGSEEEVLREFRSVRDLIRARLQAWLAEIGP